MKELTYTRKRGFHHWVCLVCGKEGEERIPDQASQEYRHNPGNPILGVCGQCNGGSPSTGIRLGNSTIPASKDGFDGEDTDNPLSYARLEGEWGEYWQIAERYSQRATLDDREDLRDTIVVRLFEVAKRQEAEGKPFTGAGKLRIASYARQDFYRAKKRLGRIISLNAKVTDDQGEETELLDTLADDKAIDLNAWLDFRVWLLGCPRKLVEIVNKRGKGIALSPKEKMYLGRWRKQQQGRFGKVAS